MSTHGMAKDRDSSFILKRLDELAVLEKIKTGSFFGGGWLTIGSDW